MRLHSLGNVTLAHLAMDPVRAIGGYRRDLGGAAMNV
jgi:hypothetical protein